MLNGLNCITIYVAMCTDKLFNQTLESLNREELLRRLWCKWMSHSAPEYDWVFDAYGGSITLEVEMVKKKYKNDIDCTFLLGYMASITSWLFEECFKIDMNQIEEVAVEMKKSASRESANPLYLALVHEGNKWDPKLEFLVNTALDKIHEYAPVKDEDSIDYFRRMIKYRLR